VDDRRPATNPREDLSPPGTGRRRILAFAASIAIHALAIATLTYFAAPSVRPRTDWIILHVGNPGIGHDLNPGASGGGATQAHLEAPKSAPAKASAPARHKIARLYPRPHLHKRPVRRVLAHAEKPRVNGPSFDATKPNPDARKSVNAANPPAADNRVLNSAETGAASQAFSAASAGTGNGIGGHGLDDRGSGTGAGMTSAYARYGENPAPEYPDEARRNNEQGTVLLRVLVDVDGSVKQVEIVHSSGFELLDDAARETVLRRWRFVPARAHGIAVESWVRVPIRFALTEADSGL
jgi:TonB family protein